MCKDENFDDSMQARILWRYNRKIEGPPVDPQCPVGRDRQTRMLTHDLYGLFLSVSRCSGIAGTQVHQFTMHGSIHLLLVVQSKCNEEKPR